MFVLRIGQNERVPVFEKVDRRERAVLDLLKRIKQVHGTFKISEKCDERTKD
jgi:hypothetical protein